MAILTAWLILFHGAAEHAGPGEQLAVALQRVAAPEGRLLVLFGGADADHAHDIPLEAPPVVATLPPGCRTLRLSVAPDDPLVAQYALDELPVLLLLDKTGRELDYVVPTSDVATLVRELQAARAGVDAVARSKERLEAVPASFFYVESLARSHARAGQFEAALPLYARCVNDGLDEVTYAAARRAALSHALVRLGARHAPLRALLEERVARWDAALRGGRDHANDARNVAAAWDALGQPARTLALYDALPPRSRARRVLADAVVPELVARRRYADVLAAGDAFARFEQRLAAAQRQGGCAHCAAGTPRLPAELRHFGVCLAEALAGTGRRDDAERLAERLRALDDSAALRAVLAGALRAAPASQPAAP